MTAAAFWWVNTVDVQTYLGSTGAAGGKFADEVNVTCWIEESADLTSNSDGREITSAATKIHGPISSAPLFVAGSKVRLPTGRVARVDKIAIFDSGSLNLGVDHFEASLV